MRYSLYNLRYKKGGWPEASLLKKSSSRKIFAGFIQSQLVRLAVAVATTAIATIGTRFRFIDI